MLVLTLELGSNLLAGQTDIGFLFPRHKDGAYLLTPPCLSKTKKTGMNLRVGNVDIARVEGLRAKIAVIPEDAAADFMFTRIILKGK